MKRKRDSHEELLQAESDHDLEDISMTLVAEAPFDTASIYPLEQVLTYDSAEASGGSDLDITPVLPSVEGTVTEPCQWKYIASDSGPKEMTLNSTVKNIRIMQDSSRTSCPNVCFTFFTPKTRIPSAAPPTHPTVPILYKVHSRPPRLSSHKLALLKNTVLSQQVKLYQSFGRCSLLQASRTIMVEKMRRERRTGCKAGSEVEGYPKWVGKVLENQSVSVDNDETSNELDSVQVEEALDLESLDWERIAQEFPGFPAGYLKHYYMTRYSPPPTALKPSEEALISKSPTFEALWETVFHSTNTRSRSSWLSAYHRHRNKLFTEGADQSFSPYMDYIITQCAKASADWNCAAKICKIDKAYLCERRWKRIDPKFRNGQWHPIEDKALHDFVKVSDAKRMQEGSTSSSGNSAGVAEPKYNWCKAEEYVVGRSKEQIRDRWNLLK